MPKVGMQPIRRDQLIRATLATIDRLGLAETTLAHVARAAGLSTGIVSHYFGDKSGLIEATMRYLLRNLRDAIAARRRTADASPRAQLLAIIDGNFDEGQINHASARAWLWFWAASLHDPQLERLQQANERRLQSNLCVQFRRVLDAEHARAAATGLAAMIDGLWLRGCLGKDAIDLDQVRHIARDYLDQQLKRGPAAPPENHEAPR